MGNILVHYSREWQAFCLLYIAKWAFFLAPFIRVPLKIDCGLWLYTLSRIKACFREHAYCLMRKYNAEPGQGVKRPKGAT